MSSSSPAESALHKLEQLLSRDPVLRDVIGRNLPRATKGGRFTPEIDVLEVDDRYVILLDVPGVPRDTLVVELDGMKLVVEGDKPSRHPQGGRSKVAERAVGRFHREFLLPSLVDGQAITAKLADGVLRIEVPRATQGRAVRVDVS
jgi:HSP20 family protein